MRKAFKAMREDSKYARVISQIFFRHYTPDKDSFDFHRDELAEAARELGIDLPKNLGDIIYSFKFRRELPGDIRATEPAGLVWKIKSIGGSHYRFRLGPLFDVRPQANHLKIKVPDATPAIVARYAQGDEQALLARIRYNRLVDIFLQVVCYSLQNHLRTQIPDFAQIETDEIYVGVGRNGAHYVVPVQAKAGRDKLGESQIEQDIALCRVRFPELICRPVGAQFVDRDTIALFEFTEMDNEIQVVAEMHYRLVPSHEMSDDDLRTYRMTLGSS